MTAACTNHPAHLWDAPLDGENEIDTARRHARVIHRGCPHGVGLSLTRPDTLNGQDAALGARHTRGPLTPPEPVRTSELP